MIRKVLVWGTAVENICIHWHYCVCVWVCACVCVCVCTCMHTWVHAACVCVNGKEVVSYQQKTFTNVLDKHALETLAKVSWVTENLFSLVQEPCMSVLCVYIWTTFRAQILKIAEPKACMHEVLNCGQYLLTLTVNTSILKVKTVWGITAMYTVHECTFSSSASNIVQVDWTTPLAITCKWKCHGTYELDDEEPFHLSKM